MANANEYVSKINIMKEEFGWEVPVELVPIPSRGVIYSPESTLHKKEDVKIKAMTAKEEDILSSAALIKEGTVLDYLIDSCLMEDINPIEELLSSICHFFAVEEVSVFICLRL